MTSSPVTRVMNQPLLVMFLCMAAIVALLIPLHHRMEHLSTNMLASLEAAKRTIEELEGGGTPTASSNERKAE